MPEALFTLDPQTRTEFASGLGPPARAKPEPTPLSTQERLQVGPPPKWTEILADPDFRELPGEQKEKFRQAYRDRLLKPMIAPQNWPSASARFDELTKASTVSGPFEHIGRKFWKGLTYDNATLGPNIVELLFLSPKSYNVSGQAAVKPLRESFARYRKMVGETFGTADEKAAPGPFSGFLGNVGEVMGAGGPISAVNIATRPGTFGKLMQLGRETLSSTGAAGGMELGQAFGEHMMPDSPIARAVAIMAGGLAGGGIAELALPTAIEMSWYRGKDLLKRSSDLTERLIAQGMDPEKAKSTASMMVKEVEQFRASNLGREFKKALDAQPNTAVFAKEAREAAEKIPGFQPNLAMHTGSSSILDAGLKAAARNDYVAMSIATSQAQAMRALNLYAESMLTSGNKTAREVVDEITKSDLYKITKELEANQGKWIELQERLTAGDFFTKADGEALIKLRNNAARSVQRSFNEQYQALYKMADEAGFQMNLGDFYADILKLEAAPGAAATRFPSTYGFLKARINRMGESEKKASELADLQTRAASAEGKQQTMLQNRIRALRQDLQAEELGAAQVPASMEEVHSFYKAINEDLFTSALTPNEARLLNDMKDRLGTRIKETNEGVSKVLGDINQAYQTNFVDVFRKGAAGRMVNETKFGFQTPEQDTLRPYLSRGAQGAAEFKRVFGEDPTAGQLVEQAIADTFAAHVKSRTLTEKVVQQFLAQHKDFLAAFPKVRERFASIEATAETLSKRADDLAVLKDNVTTAQVRALLNSTEPQRVLLQNVRSADFMRRMQDMAKRNPEAAQALAYEYGEILQGMTPQMAAEFLSAHRKELKPIFDAQDPTLYDKLMTLSLGRKVYERGWQTTGGDNLSYRMQLHVDPLERAAGMKIENIANKMWALAAGKTGNVWNTLYIGAKYFGTRGMRKWDHVLGDAFTNPQFVDRLITEQYGPLLQEAQRQGIKIEDLVRQSATNPQMAESLRNALNDVAKKGKALLGEADLGHSYKAHGYRVFTETAERGMRSLKEQEGKESESPYFHPQQLRPHKPARTAPAQAATPETPAAPASPAAPDIKAAVEAEGWTYQPEKYDYRIAPDGEVLRRKK